jgi:hypothetical protein
MALNQGGALQSPPVLDNDTIIREGQIDAAPQPFGRVCRGILNRLGSSAEMFAPSILSPLPRERTSTDGARQGGCRRIGEVSGSPLTDPDSGL